jgi:hypothetical protein
MNHKLNDIVTSATPEVWNADRQINRVIGSSAVDVIAYDVPEDDDLEFISTFNPVLVSALVDIFEMSYLMYKEGKPYAQAIRSKVEDVSRYLVTRGLMDDPEKECVHHWGNWFVVEGSGDSHLWVDMRQCANCGTHDVAPLHTHTSNAL